MCSNGSCETATSPTAGAESLRTASSAPASRSPEAALPSPTNPFGLGPPSPRPLHGAGEELSAKCVILLALSRTAGEGGERSETGEGLAAVLARPKYRYKKL